MDRAQALEELRKALIQAGTDFEAARDHADATLCELLKALGYSDVVKLYNELYTGC